MSTHRYTGGVISATAPIPTAASAPGVWTLEEALRYKAAGNWPDGTGLDQYFPYTTLLLHGDGTNGAQNNTFIDSSTNNFTVTRNGNTTQGSFDPYVGPGCWSNYFVSGSNTYLSSTGSAGTAMGTGNFTWECWVYSLGTSGYQDFIDTRSNTTVGSSDGFAFALNTGTLTPMIYTTSILLSSTVSITANAWNHVAVTRSGTTLTLWVNGVSGGSTTNSTNLSNQSFAIGSANTTSVQMNGYISNVRMVKGVALYTTAFTPPTSPLVATQQTTLLTCNGNGFIDQSATNNALTVVGTPLVSKFSPFSLYQTVPTSYSGFFDGNGDYLSIPYNASFSTSGTSSWTMEMWAYPTTFATNNKILATVQGTTFDWIAGTGFQSILYINTSGNVLFDYYNGSGANNTVTSPTVLNLNAWTHIAVVFDNLTLKIFINGALSISSSVTLSTQTGLTAVNIGGTSLSANRFFTGSISNFRFARGLAVYTAAFTPSTVPLTATTTVSASQSNSVSFDGASDYLSIANNAALTVGTGDFTIEAWVYAVNFSTNNKPIWSQGNGGIAFYAQQTTGKIGFEVYAGSAIFLSTAALSTNQWYHLAVTRSGTTVRLFINGVLDTTATSSANLSSAAVNNIGGDVNGVQSWNGYISNFRLTKGQALYTAAFTPSTTPLTTTSQGATAANVSLLTCQDRLLEDNSNNYFAVTASGDVKPSSANPFVSTNGIGGTSYSGYFDGTGDYLTVAGGMPSGQGTAFTLETWFYTLDAARSSNEITSGSGSGSLEFYVDSTGAIKLDNTGVINIAATSAGVIKSNIWYHIALTRTTGNLYSIYLNGVLLASGTNSTSMAANTTIGYHRSVATGYMYGYLSNFRVVNSLVYSSNFSPSTAPLTAITGTSLLTCQNTTFIDNSSNAFAITANGDTKTDVLNPFSGATSLLTAQSTTFIDNSAIAKTITANGNSIPRRANPFTDTVTGPTQYISSVYGGSMYFDGTGDYLTIPNATGLQLSTATPFTIDGWIYLNSITAGDNGVMSKRQSGNEWQVNINPSFGYLNFWNAATTYQSNITLVARQWYHFAISWDATTLRFFINGAAGTSHTGMTLTASTNQVNIGCLLSDGSNPFNGYISNLRLIKGTALYTAPFVPPSAPLTAVTNTQLLLNGTNGGIFDNTTSNNLETLGSAQISTSVVKYGTGSISFNGTNSSIYEPSNIAYGYGTGDFTIEFWLRLNVTTTQTIFSNITLSSGLSVAPHIYYSNGSSLRYYVNGVDRITGSSLNINQWYHIAVCRSGTSTRLFIDGAQSGSTYSDSNNYGVSNPLILADYASPPTGSSQLNGYLDDIRITKGIARYTTNFTPPAGPFPNI